MKKSFIDYVTDQEGRDRAEVVVNTTQYFRDVQEVLELEGLKVDEVYSATDCPW